MIGVGLVVLPWTDPHRVVSRDEHVVPARVGGAGGRVTRITVPVFVAASDDPELAAVAAEIGDVFRADVQFEGVYDLAPRETEPTPASLTPPTLPPIPGVPPEGAPPANWRQLGADAVTTGVVRRAGDAVIVEIRLFDAASGELAWGRGYSGPLSNPRLVAHVIADEFVQAQAGLRGVFLSKLAFVSDRGGMRRELGGTMRRFKEVWVADYDGAGQRPITTDRDLDLTPNWSPEGDRIAFTSFRRGFQEIAVVPLNGASVENPTRGLGKSWLPAWSPDGSRLAFTSNRDGNAEIYVVNRDGTDLRRLTRHWAIDTSPAWSPSGGEIAFTSDRTGSPQNLDHGRRRHQRARADIGEVLRPAGLGAAAARRGRLRVTDEDRLRHQGQVGRHRRGAAAHARRGFQREPGLVAQRAAHRVLLDAPRRPADLDDDAKWGEPATGDVGGQQHDAGLVAAAGTTEVIRTPQTRASRHRWYDGRRDMTTPKRGASTGTEATASADASIGIDAMTGTGGSPVTAAAWLLLAFLTTLNVLNFVVRQLIPSLAPLLIAGLGLSRAQIGALIGFAFVIVYSLVGVALGLVADRWSRRNLIAGGLTLWSAMTVVSGAARNYFALAIPRIFTGVGQAVLTPAALAMLGDVFPARRLGLASSIYYAGLPIGTALSLGLAGWLAPRYGWRVCFYVVGAVGLVAVALLALIREPARRSKPLETVRERTRRGRPLETVRERARRGRPLETVGERGAGTNR